MDALDTDGLPAFLAEDAVVRIPGALPVAGKWAIRQAFLRLSLAVDDLRHRSVALWIAAEFAASDADLELTLPGRTVMTLPATYLIRWKDGVVADLLLNVYLESRVTVAIASFGRLWRGERPRGAHPFPTPRIQPLPAANR